MWMNPPTFHVTKVDEDPKGFINEVFNVVDYIGLTRRKKAELDNYKLKDVAQLYFEQLRSERSTEIGSVDWRNSKRLS